MYAGCQEHPLKYWNLWTAELLELDEDSEEELDLLEALDWLEDELDWLETDEIDDLLLMDDDELLEDEELLEEELLED